MIDQSAQLGFNFGPELLRAAKRHKDKVLFQDPVASCSYARMGWLMISYALHLRHRGVRPGSLVALVRLDGPTQFAMVGALALLGAAWVDGTRAALGSRLRITDVVHAAAGKDLPGTRVFRIDPSWRVPPRDMPNLAQQRFSGFDRPDAVAHIRQSSGSTGERKFMIGTAKMAAFLLSRFHSSDEIVPLFPPGSILFVTHVARSMLGGGQVLIGMDHKSAEAAGAKTVIGSPHQLASFIKDHDPARGPQVQNAFVSGAVAPPALRRQLLGYFERLTISYGSTETGRIAGNVVDLANVEDMSVGKVLPPARVEIVNEADSPVPAGQEGIVRVKAPEMVSGYLEQAPAGRSAFHDGWFYPGDIGVLAGDGQLTIRGRTDDRLNLGGTKIDANAIDRVLTEVEGVADGAAFGWSDGALSKLGVALVAKPGAEEAQLREAVGNSLQRAFGPKGEPQAIVFVPKLPLNANGKVMRRELAANLPAASNTMETA